ncbi:MAG: DUF971 domain-containing protein [Myxococcales bacterium]|nr:DUF971 domain-containing protein [Myxococcales bacterium]
MANPQPVELRAKRGAHHIEIVWDDGVTTSIDHDILRGFCPCARCQGHQGEVKFVAGDASEIVEIEEIGDYALRFAFPDCGTGIYTFAYLRRLAAIDRTRVFEVGDPLPS